MTQDFTNLWNQAKEAAQQAAQAQNAKLGNENSRGFDCGFAWLTFSGKTPFARWAKKADLSSENYPSGRMIWYSKLHSIPTQSVSVHEAACNAAREVLAHGLQTSAIGVGSRLD